MHLVINIILICMTWEVDDFNKKKNVKQKKNLLALTILISVRSVQ